MSGPSQESIVRVRVGQIWASTHNQDVRAGLRQRRQVMIVDATHAYLKTLDGPRRLGYPGVKITRNGISGHRLVAERA
jgi:hypothetical protein